MRLIMHLVRLVFAPQRFISVVTDEIVVKDSAKNPSVLLPNGDYPPERRAGVLKSVTGQTKNLRGAFTKGIIATAVTIAIGVVVGLTLRHFFGVPSKLFIYGTQAAGAAVILGATLAEVGGDIMTWDKESVAEELNKLIFHGLYVLGTFLFVLSFAWDAA
jgi:hypothetical protein